MSQFHETIIIGSGFGGIGAAIKLRDAGHDDIKILEKADSLGGCWRDNTYPGAACDVPSHLYSYSFEPNFPWSRRFAPQKDILAYQQKVAAKYGVDKLCQFNAEVATADFDEAQGLWQISTTDGQQFTCRFLIAATGQLSQPSIPNIPGLEEFKGQAFHSARWPKNLDLTGKKVAAVGTGASAIQFVPEVAKVADKLTLFQRSAAYVLAKPDIKYTEKVKQLQLRFPILRKAERAWLYSTFETRVLGFGALHKAAMRAYQLKFKLHLKSQIKDKELRDKLTPDYAMGCKRILLSNNYYPALAQSNVEVENSHIKEITDNAVITKDGSQHEADVIIFGTGFKAVDFLAPIKVTGLNGKALNDTWEKGAEAYKGIAVPEFPNLFILYGPNTNLGHNSIIYMLESQFEYILNSIKAVQRHDAKYMDVKKDVMRQYNDNLQKQLSNTVWQSGCDSWYVNESGKNTNNWPTFTFKYRALAKAVKPSDYHFEQA